MMLTHYFINCQYLEFSIMMKKKFPILAVLFVLCFSFSLNGQDLIDRTRDNITIISKDSSPNLIAERINLEKNNQIFKEFALFDINQQRSNKEFKEYLYDAVFLNLRPNDLNATFNARLSNMTLEIPVSSTQSFELELSQVEVLSPSFVLRTSDGKAYSQGDFPVLFYRGIVKGDPNSTATITIFENEIKGLITDRDGNYVLAPITGYPEQYTLYNDKNLVAENTSQCGTDDDLMHIGASVEEQVENTNRAANCVEVFVETDFYTFQSHGSSLINFENFLSSLFSEVATLYSNENIEISLSEVFVWTSPDPYASLNSTSAILEKFGEVRQNDYTGRLAHFISARNLGGGVAWLDVLCYNYFTFNADWNGDGVAETHHAGPYAVSGSLSTLVVPIPTFSWNVNVFAHEMGHNFGSPHTQRCVWGPNNNQALDNCVGTEGSCGPGPTPLTGGTVMSYCHLTPIGINLNHGFGEEPGDLIRDRFNNASCNLTCEGAVQLPIELLTFTAKENNQSSTLLEWTTATEINASHFEIERRAIGKSWEELDKVAAIGQSSDIEFYQFEDKNPLNGENFYRLKQVDLNGEFIYSDIEVLTFKGGHNIVFNNPVHDILNVNIRTLETKITRMTMYDAHGRLVSQRFVDLVEGFNTVEWDMSYLSKGIYFIHVDEDTPSVFKLVKM